MPEMLGVRRLLALVSTIAVACSSKPAAMGPYPFAGDLRWSSAQERLERQPVSPIETTRSTLCPTLVVADQFLCLQTPPPIPPSVSPYFRDFLMTAHANEQFMVLLDEYYETHESRGWYEPKRLPNGMLQLDDGEIVSEPPDD